MDDREGTQERLRAIFLLGIAEAVEVLETAPRPGDRALLDQLNAAGQAGQDSLAELYVTAIWQSTLRKTR